MNEKDLLKAIRRIDTDYVKKAKEYREKERLMYGSKRYFSFRNTMVLLTTITILVGGGLLISSLVVNSTPEDQPKNETNSFVAANTTQQDDETISFAADKLLQRSADARTGLKEVAEHIVLDPEYKETIYAEIDKVMESIVAPNKRQVKSYIDINDYEEEYEMLAKLGDEAVPYIFSYIVEKELYGSRGDVLIMYLAKYTGISITYDEIELEEGDAPWGPATPPESAYAWWLKAKDIYFKYK